jgi:DNA-binding SARP family transcriptional activator/tetratricopeptide (TPR) repeat protein
MHLHLASAPRVATADGPAQVLAALDGALLAWLALEGPTPRNRLAALLWPDKPAEAARNSLRQRLFQLRRQVGVELVEGGATAALAAGISHDLHDADTLLDGMAIEVGGEFAQWLALQRDRRRARVRRSLAELAAMAEAAKDWDDALAHAGELLALEPLSEEAHRRVMRLHYLAGDRAAALLAFDRCAQVLKDEVGAPPSAETMALLATVSAAADAASTAALPAHAAVPASVLRPPRLVGRGREIAALDAAWRAGQVAGLVGEAGLGKTRLLHEFAMVAAPGPALVVATGRPGDAGVPFATLARLLRAVAGAGTGAAPAGPPALSAATRGEIARVLPEFDAGASAPRGEGQRLVLLRAVRALLAAQPALATLVVDDLHFADAASLDLLASLADGEERGEEVGDASTDAPPLRWLFAWRPAEAGSPLHALLDRLTESARLVPIALAPLDDAALAELVDSLGLPGIDGRALAPGLRQRTGGNPLFVLETLKQAWVEHTLGELADARRLPRPLSVGRLIERRLAQLSPGALALARVAAIAGVDFSIELAESVLQAGALQFADALNELEAAQVLRGTTFAHDLVFDAVRASVPQAVAQLTHARVATWLEPRGAEPARIAQHWLDAGRDAQALPWLDRAAQAALRALRPREFIAFRDRQSTIEAARGERAAAFDAGLAALQVFAETDNEAQPLAERVARLQRLADDDRQRCELQIQSANAALIRGDGAQAVPSGEAALALAQACGDASCVARSRRVLGSCLAIVDRLADAAQHLEAAVAWLQVHADDARVGEAHGDLGIIYDNLGRPGEALPHHRSAYALCVRAGRVTDAALASGNLACNRIDAGDLAAADDALALAQQLVAANEGQSSQQGMSQIMRALTLAHLGRYRDALVQAELGEVATQRSQSGYETRARMRVAQLWWHLGQWARLQRHLDALPDGADEPLPLRVHHAILRWHAAAHGLGGAGAAQRARVALDGLAEELADGRRPDLGLHLRIERAAALDAAAALAELDAVRANALRIGHGGTLLATHVRAAAAATGHDPARARREAVEVLALHERGLRSIVLLPAEPWLHASRALRSAGDPAADAIAQQGADWLRRTAREQVPEPFRDSFLQRNPVNRALLALAATVAAS